MLFFILLFGCFMVAGGVYVALDQRRERNEKLAKIQRELARREAAEPAKNAVDPQN
ncbi:hypothetical protein [Litorimonas cladophorae]|nr:hypothetical protein [Litorimonas cladophorae]